MEKISAALAMQWSVELEKGLRSKKPGGAVEAILRVGPRLVQWSKDPCPTMAMLNMFGLVPGEDKLFANAILLRLADAFRTGDKHTKLSVLKIFLLEHKHRVKKGKTYRGILAKERVPNYLEMLRRVKIVFDMGDVESRALALYLLGCWADIAHDNADIRHMVLSSFGSCHVLEVKASLFAAGCFSELSEDFASIVLDLLVNMVTSSKASSDLKLAGAPIFAKMGYSPILTNRAYKTGRKLVPNCSQDEFLSAMLISLSKLAFKSIFLISEQVEFLLSFITEKNSIHILVVAYRCLFFLLGGGLYCFPLNVDVIRALFRALSDNFPAILQHEALQIFCKIFQFMQPSIHQIEVSELVKFISDVERAAKSPIIATRFFALRLLVDISCNHKLEMEAVHAIDSSLPLPSHVITLILDQMAKNFGPSCKVISECQSLLKLVLNIVEEYPTFGFVALNKIGSCVESMVNGCKEATRAKKQGSPSIHEVVEIEGENIFCFASKLACCMYRFVASCCEILDESSSITAEVREALKCLVKFILKSDSFKYEICAIYKLLLFSYGGWSYSGEENEQICNLDNDLGIPSENNWIECQRFNLAFAKQMMRENNNWGAYKAGKLAASQGAWFATAFTFRKLMEKVESDIYHHWLKSLACFARSESSILLLSHKQIPEILNNLQINENEIWFKFPMEHGAWSPDSRETNEVLSKACNDVHFAAETLAAAASFTTDKTFIFQRWFLTLRARVLEIVNDIFRLLSTYKSSADNIRRNEQVEEDMMIDHPEPEQHMHALFYFFSRILIRSRKLVQEIDLLAISFVGMDNKSFRTIAQFALNCSLLAFCIGFASYHPKLHSYEQRMHWGVEKVVNCSLPLLVQDVAARLSYIDSETSTTLKQLSTLFGEPSSCFCILHRALVEKASLREKETLDVCRFATFGVIKTFEGMKGMNSEEILAQSYRARLQLLSDVLNKWMGMPFLVPKFFFQVRPCIGAELFVFNTNTKNGELSIFQGFHLSLNLCMQLKHAPPIRLTKMFCILASTSSFQISKQVEHFNRQVHPSFQAWEDDDTVDLHHKLFSYVTKGTQKTGKEHARCNDRDGLVWSCIEFEPNERSQGFSSCLLDVSAFPLGSYKIKWHGGCIDHRGSYWSLLPLNMNPIFNVKNAPGGG